MAKGFGAATKAYYRWLGGYLRLDKAGLRRKRQKMEGSVEEPAGTFAFFRGTFYLWRGQFCGLDPVLRSAPVVLSAGDVHLENFGTWRDAEGRLVWGVNDFDEAAALPFTSDLIRLATSVLLAARDAPDAIAIGTKAAMAAIEEGYAAGLKGGAPFVLESAALNAIRLAALGMGDPDEAWAKLETDGKRATPTDLGLQSLLLTALPPGARAPRFFSVRKGLGSLGRERWMVIADWNGGRVAREAKATAPSAWHVGDARADRARDLRRLAAEARRAPDPGFLVTRHWVVRRLSPEMRKIELADLLPRKALPGSARSRQAALLWAMGGEIANLHAGASGDARDILAWLKARPAGAGWLAAAARHVEAEVLTARDAFLADPGVVEG